MPLVRSQLVSALKKRFDYLREEDCEIAVRVILEGISNQVAIGGRVEVRKFGVFKCKYMGPRTSRNPKTGEKVPVKASRYPHFSPARELNLDVNLHLMKANKDS
jgi:integration host factor subunit beta